MFGFEVNYVVQKAWPVWILSMMAISGAVVKAVPLGINPGRGNISRHLYSLGGAAVFFDWL